MESSKTQQIFELTAPYKNPYQGTDAKLLFVCSAGILRSATAANLFARKGYNTRCCGTSEYALIPLSANLIAWADKIYFVHPKNHMEAQLTFQHVPELLNKIQSASVLDIPDIFDYNEPTLLRLLEEQVKV